MIAFREYVTTLIVLAVFIFLTNYNQVEIFLQGYNGRLHAKYIKFLSEHVALSATGLRLT